ncbi:type II secretion system F family protein [Paenibacillus sp. y28]|uniref:type II secretion system F family protein n=1 Tax=Paenibacillus sp. y28 TaxID=3129110 RepID=UPI00301B254D
MNLLLICLIVGIMGWLVLVLLERRASGGKRLKGKLLPDHVQQNAEAAHTDVTVQMHQEWIVSIEAKATAGRPDPAGGRASEISYTVYTLSRLQRMSACFLCGAVLFVIAYLFYKQPVASLIAACGGLFAPKYYAAMLCRKRISQLELEFKQLLQSLSVSLTAGRSVENAFAEAASDMRMLYPSGASDMICELELIRNKIRNGEPIEKALLNFAERSGSEDVRSFADVFATCKRTGGDLVEVIRRTSRILGDKMEMDLDIRVLVAKKKFEAKLMGIIPFGIVGLLSFSSADYMQPLYEGVGRIIMTIALLLLLAGLVIIQKMTEIKL